MRDLIIGMVIGTGITSLLANILLALKERQYHAIASALKYLSAQIDEVHGTLAAKIEAKYNVTKSKTGKTLKEKQSERNSSLHSN